MTPHFGRLATAVVVAVLHGPAAGLAQQLTPPPPPYEPASPADDKYVAPKIGQAYLQALAKLPDWNGMWVGNRFKGLTAYCATCADFRLAPDPAPADAVGRNPNFPAGSKDLGIPYNAEYMKVYDARIEKAKRGADIDPDNCLSPHPTPDAMTTAFDINGGVEIIMLPNEVRMVWDWLNASRRIYTDGRPHPSADDLWPTYMGHSTGKWEGDTLVVDTIGMFSGNYDMTGAPYSDKVHMVERLRLIGPDKLENRITIDDPVMLTKPFEVRRTYSRTILPRNAIVGSYCNDVRDSNSSVPASLIN
ncbi:MAG TPA: hypothetical protein VL358_05465 [Caulobacteraceae bacterium]|jgi:hypothetical protein|nr:hypothetical protein [Caulobacteraceae bacterium]